MEHIHSCACGWVGVRAHHFAKRRCLTDFTVDSMRQSSCMQYDIISMATYWGPDKLVHSGCKKWRIRCIHQTLTVRVYSYTGDDYTRGRSRTSKGVKAIFIHNYVWEMWNRKDRGGRAEAPSSFPLDPPLRRGTTTCLKKEDLQVQQIASFIRSAASGASTESRSIFNQRLAHSHATIYC